MLQLASWLFLIPVIAVALLVAKLIRSWSDLPDRVAVHFGINGEPNGYASKSAFAVIIVAITVGLTASALMLVLLTQAPPIAYMAIVLAAITAATAFWQAINYNITGQPLRIGVIFIPEIILIAIFFFFFLSHQPLKH